MAKNKYKVLYNVYVVNEKCNLKCKYCETGESEFLNTLSNHSRDKCMRHNHIIEKSREIYDASILKIVGGGEIFLEPDIEKWILKEEKNYNRIIILTNGTMIQEKQVDKLSRMKNLVMGISLDGHTYDMNEYRFKDYKIFERVLSTLNKFGKNNVPIQLNMVMHDKNANNFFEYLDYLKDLKFKLILCCSPIMDKISKGDIDKAVKIWLSNLKCLLKKYDIYKEILLPKAYYQYLIDFYTYGKRKINCKIPYFMVQLFSSGELTACPIVWNKHIGNVEDYSSKLFEEDIYCLLCHSKRGAFFCRRCISSYDIFNLYIDNKISIEELEMIPIYADEKIAARMKEIKETIKSGDQI